MGSIVYFWRAVVTARRDSNRFESNQADRGLTAVCNSAGRAGLECNNVRLPAGLLIYDALTLLCMQAHRYSWVENWSEEHSRPFYYNQRTKVSRWEKPADLAWRRVQAEPLAAAGSEEL